MLYCRERKRKMQLLEIAGKAAEDCLYPLETDKMPQN